MGRAISRLMAIMALCLGVTFVVTSAQAGDIVPKVPIDKTKGSCVLPGEQMRREHMNILKHRRDQTMYQGIRGGKRSLEQCLTCHAVKGDDGKPVTVASPKHFCRVCHDYAAVQVDCWTCHKSVPEKNPFKAAENGMTSKKILRAEVEGLKTYLEGGAK